MAASNFTIKLYLEKSVKKHRNGYPVYCRVTYQRKKAPFATGQ